MEDAYRNMPILGDSLEFDALFNPTVAAFIEENGDSATNLMDAPIAFANPPVAQTDLVTKYWTLGQAHADIPDFDVTGEPYDFSYPGGAPQATAGTDGKQLGDPRWTLCPTGLNHVSSNNKIKYLSESGKRLHSPGIRSPDSIGEIFMISPENQLCT